MTLAADDGIGNSMTLDDREAFVAMRLFLEQFYARAGNDMDTLIADITLEEDGQPLDPAAWTDWLRCVGLATSGGEHAAHIVHRFHTILDGLPGLPPPDVEQVEQLVQVGEWAIAIENLCTQLYEYGVAVDSVRLAMIENLGHHFGVADRYWNILVPAEPESRND